MPRPATGTIVEKRGVRGITFALRVTVDGERQYITLGPKRYGWTRLRAETELARVLHEIRAGTWNAGVPTGIHVRHSRNCNTVRDAPCSCEPSYQAWVYSSLTGGKLRRTFHTLIEARTWRKEMLAARVSPNPLSELRALCDARIAQQEEALGEALPHLYLARDTLREIEQAAASDSEFLWKGIA